MGASLLALALAMPVVASVITTDLFIVREGAPITEDVYVAAQSGIVEGTIDGDLVIVTGDLTISGLVTGSVTAVTSGLVTVTETGRIEGSLRMVGPRASVEGSVAGDVATTALSTSVAAGGRVGRDLISFGGTVRIDGEVGRDVRGRAFEAVVDGTVGNDVDVTISRLRLGEGAVLGGDLLYRSAGEASIAGGAVVSGRVTRLPGGPTFLYGVILTLANVVSLLAFLVIGFVVLWLVRATSARAVDAVLRRPARSLVTGIATLVLAPILMVLFAVTLVGIPISLALIVLLLLALVVGPLPFVTALAHRLLRGRAGLFGAFLLGAVVWRLGIWFIPWIGGFLFLIGLAWGTGAWIVGAWEQRASGDRDDLLPPSMRDDDLTPDWDFPLPPLPAPERPLPEESSPERSGTIAPQPATADGPASAATAISDPEPVGEDERDPAPEPGPVDEANGDGPEEDSPPADEWGLPTR